MAPVLYHLYMSVYQDIIEAKMQYERSGWISYDRCFCLNAAAQPDQKWSLMDGALWNIAFAGAASLRSDCCKLSFTLSHKSEECACLSSRSTKTRSTADWLTHSLQSAVWHFIMQGLEFYPLCKLFLSRLQIHACVRTHRCLVVLDNKSIFQYG